MGRDTFWTSHPDYATQLPAYLGESDKTMLAQNATVFDIVRVIAQPRATYQGNPTPRWCLILASNEWDSERTLTLAMNAARDEMFADMAAWLKEGGDAIPATLQWIVPTSGGNGFYVINPGDDETPF